MRYLELRRHTLREPGNPHISQRGLDLARRTGVGMGQFARIISSPEPRAIETAIAMGFAVDELYEPVQCDMRKRQVRGIEKLLPYSLSFQQRLAIAQDHKSTRRYLAALVSQWTKLAKRIPSGKSFLVISHGGYLEDSAIACLPSANHRSWGANFGHCEGIRLTFNRGYFTSGQILRA